MYFVRRELREALKAHIANMDDDWTRTKEEEAELLEMLEKKITSETNEEQRERKFELRLELEFEVVDELLRDVMDVEIIRDIEQREFK